jgi:hypothetical protein
MKKHRTWLFAAVVLLALAAFLMSRGDRDAQAKKPPAVAFPRKAKPEEQARNQRRRTLPPAPVKDDQEEGVRTKRDPVITALPTTPGKSALVFEASALKNSPIGELWLDCMLSQRGLSELKRFKEQYGVNPLEDVERIAFSSERVGILSGDFAGARFDTLASKQRSYGDKGTIYEPEEGQKRFFAAWGKDLVLFGRDVESLQAAIDRLEDRGKPAPPVIPDWASYGDVYGVLSAADLAEMLPKDQREIAERLKGAVDKIELHVDASDDVAMVADVTGPDGDEVKDFGKTLGTALSLGRLKAQSDGDDKLAELLDYARVAPRDGRFSVELALPMAVIQRQMGPCRRDRDEDEEKADED